MSKNIFFLFLIFTGGFCFAKCPYSILRHEFFAGQTEGFSQKASAVFEIKNESEKNITGFTIVFTITDLNGENPFIEGNTLICRCQQLIEKDCSVNFAVNLDPYLADSSLNEFRFERIFIQLINYEDETIWKDKFGMYALEE